jgi:hypothetical protein
MEPTREQEAADRNRRDWHAPDLELLGDVVSNTRSGSGPGIDGSGLS